MALLLLRLSLCFVLLFDLFVLLFVLLVLLLVLLVLLVLSELLFVLFEQFSEREDLPVFPLWLFCFELVLFVLRCFFMSAIFVNPTFQQYFAPVKNKYAA